MPKPVEILIKFLFSPIFWGAAFLAPLMAALMVQMGLEAPLGLRPIAFTLVLGTLWGVYAQVKGSWL